MENYFKVILTQRVKNCARHMGNRITWNSKYSDDIHLKRRHFHCCINGLCIRFKGILNNYHVVMKLFYAHCFSFCGSKQWDLYNKPFVNMCTALQKAVRKIYNLPYCSHRYLLPCVVGCEHIQKHLIKLLKKFFDALKSSSNAIAIV